eukprot:TRINITY_DN10677_c0_g2_i2.p1 TRINITY_DN10677_c0_g2~~TRINITY_DN10677_c0_g2_i2.p1  ORF type:complete len:484 (+),score=99.29 TRINITY_DN10677_c0_g2_i2:237-1688(+)
MANQSQCVIGLEAILAAQERVANASANDVALPVCDPEIYGTSTDAVFIFLAGTLVLMMQIGFALLEAGSSDERNAGHILFKNTLDMVIGALAWFLVGYPLAFGTQSYFAGFSGFMTVGLSACEYSFWYFQFSFCATAVTIISGAIAGRTAVKAYVAYASVITSIVYPVVVHWAWSGKAWLAEGKDGIGFKDFAGSGVVHATGGMAALVACVMMGPRIARLKNNRLIDIPPHSVPLVAMGGLLLCICFMAFNGGSQLRIDDDTGEGGVVVARAAINTIMAMSGAGVLASLMSTQDSSKLLSVSTLINSLLGGAVAICAGADRVAPWGALIIGGLAALVYKWSSAVIRGHLIDDACDAISVHLSCGLFGLVMAPLFETDTGVLYAWDEQAFKQLAWNILGGVVICAWSGTMSYILFRYLRDHDMLRVSQEAELAGLDSHEHGGSAYAMTDPTILNAYNLNLQELVPALDEELSSEESESEAEDEY